MCRRGAPGAEGPQALQGRVESWAAEFSPSGLGGEEAGGRDVSATLNGAAVRDSGPTLRCLSLAPGGWCLLEAQRTFQEGC